MAKLGSRERKPLVRPQFTDTTMSMSPAEKSIIADLFGLAGGGLIIETGTYHGYTTSYLCQLLELNDLDGRVVSFDLPGMMHEAREHNKDLAEHEAVGRLELVSGHLPSTLSSWLASNPGEIDLAVLDADHHFAGLTKELELVWGRLSAKGYIVCDDYHQNHPEVVAAVNRFAEKSGAHFLPISQSNPEFANLGVLCKPRWRAPWYQTAVYSLRPVREFVRRIPILGQLAVHLKRKLRG